MMYTHRVNMTTCLVIGDPHFKVKNISKGRRMADRIVEIAEERQPDFIVVLGDILDRHETIHVDPLCLANSFMYRLSHVAHTYLLIGNHDRPNNSDFLSDRHPFTALKTWQNVTIVDYTTYNMINGQPYVFVPYVPPGMFGEALDKYDGWMNAKCIFAHQEFRGVKMGCESSSKGDIWPANYPLVVSGHIHEYQVLASNLRYTGTPIQQNFGEQDHKTISWYTFTTDGYQEERIDLGLPRNVIIEIECNDIISTEIPEYDDVKVIINGTSAEIKTAMKSHKVQRWKKSGAKIVYKDIPLVSTFNSYPTRQPCDNYSSMLSKIISENKSLCDLYSEIFGKVSSNNKTKLMLKLV